jgi:hypothetical protein
MKTPKETEYDETYISCDVCDFFISLRRDTGNADAAMHALSGAL